MKKIMEIYNLLTESDFKNEVDRNYLENGIKDQYERNSATSRSGKITKYRSIRDLAQTIQNYERKLNNSEIVEEENCVKYKFTGKKRTIEVVAPKEVIIQGRNTRFEFIPESLEILDTTSKKVQAKHTENLRIKKSIAKIALCATVLTGSILGMIKVTEDLNEKEQKRRENRDKYAGYYTYYQDIMPYDAYVDMVDGLEDTYKTYHKN